LNLAPATPSPAATVLLLRTTHDGIEVLMQRRDDSLSFMGGMWVYPGGRHEPADRSEALLSRVRSAPGQTVAPMKTPAGKALPGDAAMGLHVTACRETFEECGVLLASNAEGHACFEAATWPDFESRRQRVATDAASFGDLLRDLGLYLDVSALVYWSHWITPAAETRRFDTRFFAVDVPESIATAATDQESSEQRWMRPADALEESRQGRLAAAPPTIFTLEDLADGVTAHGSVSRMLAAERGRAVPPICPVMTRTTNGIEVRMPWDPDYQAGAGNELERPAAYPAHFARRASLVRIEPGFAMQFVHRGPAA